MNKTYVGIDYGMGKANIDSATGIRFGVISQNSIMPEAFDDIFQSSRDLSFEAAQAELKSEIKRTESEEELLALFDDRLFNSDAFDASGLVFPLSDESAAEVWEEIEQAFADSYCDNGDHDWLYEKDGYKLTNCLQSDVFVLASPYFTYAQFCSPCVPGACNLDSPLDFGKDWQVAERNNRCFCLGHDWFDDGRAPYPVYSVETGELVNP